VPRSRSRLPSSWIATQWMLLGLPLLVAGRMARELEGTLDQVVAAELIVNTTVPWAVALGLLLGMCDSWFVPAALRGDASARLRASSLRMLAVLTVAPAALWMVMPPDLMETGSIWRRLGAWLAVAVVPLWSTSLLLRARGRGHLASGAVTAALVGVLVAGTSLLTRASFLHASASVAPLAAAGIVASVGVYLAVSERVGASLSRVLGATYGLAAATSLLLALTLGRTPDGAAWVVDIAAVDPAAGRVAVIVEEPNTLDRLLEVDIDTGAVIKVPRRVGRVGYAGGYRVEMWSPRIDFLRARPTRGYPCAVDPAGLRRCAAVRFESGSQPMNAHPRRPLVVTGDHGTLLVWDLAADRAWRLEREGRVRWPCFTDAGDLIWRIQTDVGPYVQERLRLDGLAAGTSAAPSDVTASVERLAIDHDERCARDSPVLTEAAFVRGRHAAGRAALMAGPGIPGGEAVIEEEVGGVAWSRDGMTAVLAVGRPRSVRFYREDLGLTAGASVPKLLSPKLSRDGRWLAHRLDGPQDPYRVVVRSVPDAALRLETTTEASTTEFDGRGRVLRVQDGRLRAVDPESGTDVALFPRGP
jgi:hypothetical protein